ncbi:hypothetical protein [Paractinoplanes lichenicola]|uniref:Uncharacterized protein n=1 Tax=Paractinoplanes lichenicola TaxID=2802976 RepID=A0ABS1VUP0_9ACTN|nr:hypothetical protein [Actinoplanes lichenicola]MBL7258180.1 hypothetical protein [Actinoplanes lichenicola]
MRGLAATVAATILVIAQPLPARAAEAIEFADARPAVINLETAEVEQRWRVPVLDGRPGRRHDFFLTVAFRPAGVLEVESRRLTLDEGEVGAFVVTLLRKTPGSGELLLSSGGAIVRRAISTSSRPAPAPVAISSLQFAGFRLAPFGETTRVDDVVIPDAPGAAADPRPAQIGMLTSRRGDTAEVVRQGTTFTVTGVSRPGEYQGVVDLLPGRPGGEAQGTLRLRDLPVWPLLVLILGLLVVHLLNRYHQRERPRNVLDLNLARLRDEAEQVQAALNGTYRITAAPREPPLVLDHRADEARRRFDEVLTDGERADWDAGGAEYLKIAGLVDSFTTLADLLKALNTDRFDRAGDRRIERALDKSPVGEALRGRPLYSESDLHEAVVAVSEARAYLRTFHRLYRQAARISAGDVLAKLTDGPEDLTALDAEVQKRYRAWEPDPITDELPGKAAATVGRAPVKYHVKVSHQDVDAADILDTSARRRPKWIATAAVLLLVPIVASAVYLVTSAGQPAGVAPAANTTAPTGRPPATAPPGPAAPPELPVAAEPRAPSPRRLPVAQPAIWRLVVYGTVLPLVAAGAVIIVGLLVRRLWRPRRSRLDSALLDRRVRRSDRRFALIGDGLIVLSGMSVLYAANPTFGTVGDYLTVALWGTAFGEGLTLARRLWPGPIVRV